MFRYAGMLLAVLVIFASSPLFAQSCGAGGDCPVAGGDYRISLPENREDAAPIGAIVFAHGYSGSSAGVMRNMGLRRMASDLGVALIALNASGGGWNLPNSPGHGNRADRDEMVYVDRVLNDATARFGLDRERIVAAGFSAGGMFVWNLICERSNSFMGFVPMSGTFWKAAPKSCSSPPANVIHIHGDADPTG
ncbi:MAG: PHB depolymerase family esterase, partial [Halocynthiibacter sp.]